MFIGLSIPIPNISNLPGSSRPGGGGGGGDTTSFIMEIDTSIVGSTPNNQFRLYSAGNTGSPYTIDWGDGSSDVDTTSYDITHTYPASGVYEISITSPYNRIRMGSVNDRKKITEIKQWGNLSWTTMDYSFAYASNLNITATDTGDFSDVTSWSQAFRNNSNLSNLGNYSNWVTSNCTNLFIMFLGCGLSGTFDFTGWNVSNVTNMGYLLGNNIGITSIDTTGWDVSKVTNFSNAFSGLGQVTIIGHENWQLNTTSNVNLSNLFYAGTQPSSLDPSAWDVSKVTSFSQTFRAALNNVGSIDLSNWDVSSATSLYIIFGFNMSLTSVGDISGWDVSNVTNLGYLMANCYALNLPNLSSWDTSSNTNLSNAFSSAGTSSVSGIENWNTSNVTVVNNCFMHCRSLNTTAINWDLRKCSSLSQMFRSAYFGNSAFTLNIQTDSTLTNVFGLFLSSLFDDITIGNNVDFSNVTNFSYMFGSMGNLSLTLPANFSFASGTNFTQFLTGTTLSSSDYNTLLIYIEASNQNNNISFDAPTCVATGAGLTARNALINDHSWTINDNS